MLKKIKKIIFYPLFFIFIFNSLIANISYIQGNLRFKNVNIGATKIKFIDSENKINTVITDIYGNFNLYLPSKTYKIKIDKIGYLLDKKDDIIYNFSHKKNIKLSLELNEIPSFISGQVIDNTGNSINDSTIYIRGSDNNITIHTDKNGYFKSNINSGIFYLTTEAKGYNTNFIVKNIENFSSITDFKIKLNRKTFDISGIISDGTEVLNNITIFLTDTNNKILLTTKSSENGFYEFTNIPGDTKVFLKIGTEPSMIYISNPIELHKNLKNNYIIINKKDVKSY